MFVTNPHNPSGRTVPLDTLRALARDVAPALLFVDEAYADFSGETLIDPATFAVLPNLVVGRTFSKAYGLAGLRVGVARRGTRNARAAATGRPALQRERVGGSGAARRDRGSRVP